MHSKLWCVALAAVTTLGLLACSESPSPTASRKAQGFSNSAASGESENASPDKAADQSDEVQDQDDNDNESGDPIKNAPTASAPSPSPASSTPVSDPKAEAVKKKCTPQVEYVNDGSAGGKKFEKYVPDAKLAIIQAAHYICSVLYKDVSEVPPVAKVQLFIEKDPDDGVAYVRGSDTIKELHFNTDYIDGKSGDSIKLEIDGVLIHESTHIWQWSGRNTDGGLIEGIADYVRAGGGWYEPGTRNSKGGTYNEAYTTSAFFIGWLNEKYPGFAQKFNLIQKAYPGPSYFKTATGVDVDTLWAQYQKEGTFSPKVPAWQLKAPPIQLGK